ncbi:MAG: hypothetical protein IPH44_34845 [Myxococcales bacterium]|nr:hypothetical protein [Myxococcales bacterium]MBK7197391.1 hypothetical protein [Myxococcales bacterium]MBP6845779.1 hypothetical protein [Kofleriaceae bacterium]
MSHPPRLPGIRFALTTLATLGLVACDASSEGTIDGPPPVDAGVDGPFDNGTTVVATTRVGDPRWETTGWQLAAVSSWAAADGVWAAHVFNSSVNAFGPGTPHAPPYDAEISDAMTRLGLDPGNVFFVDQWREPRNLVAFGVIVPSATAPSGSTADYASGPYIPGDLRLRVDGDLIIGGTVVDPDFDSDYPTYREIAPQLTVDGSSHLPLTFGESTMYIPGDPGQYRLRVQLREIATPGNGWNIEVSFTVR